MLSVVTSLMGCGDKNPAGPSGSGTAVIGLAISGADAVLTGASASYTVTAALADGTMRPVTPVWTSSNPGVAAVDGGGRLEGLAHGSTDLTASSEGRTASKTVQVVNNYGGNWTGRYVIRACDDTGDLTDRDGGWCRAGPGRVGTVEGILLRLVQSGDNLSEIRGEIGSFTETLTGTVSADGRLSLGGTLTIRDFEFPDSTIATRKVGSWDTTLDGARGMTGRWAEDLTSFSGRKGTAHTEHELVTMRLLCRPDACR